MASLPISALPVISDPSTFWLPGYQGAGPFVNVRTQINSILPANVVREAPNDGKQYGRKSNGWAEIAVQEAPNDGKQYARKANAWAEVAQPPPATSIGDNPPASPVHGQQWWKSDTGNMFIYYNDGNTSQWVQVNIPAQLLDAYLPTTGGTITGDLSINGSAITNNLWTLGAYSGAPISGLVPGSTAGALIEAPNGRHIVVGIRDNDVGDSFSIVSRGGDDPSGTSPYDKLAFSVRADGTVYSYGTNTIQWSDDGAGAGPDLALTRVSASPAVSDVLGRVAFYGRSSTGVTRGYGSIVTQIRSPTNAAEEGAIYLQTITGGALANSMMVDGLNNTLAGNLAVGGNVQSAGGYFYTTTPNAVFCGNGGSLYFRPVAQGDPAYQMTYSNTGLLATSGSITSGGNVYAKGGVLGSDPATAALILAANGSTIYLRPNGQSDNTNQMTFSAAGALNVPASIDGATIRASSAFYVPASGYSSTGAADGKTLQATALYSSRAGSTNAGHVNFYNANGLVGSINTSASATTYNTTSDETLKDFIGEYDPQKAIDIIKADPVRDFHWKADGSYAVGWGAQTSYEVSPDLAQPPDLELEGAHWGMDQGRRTPYLWAALSNVLARLEALEAKNGI